MRNWKRAWALALTAALCLGLLSGCGQEETSLSVCVGGEPEDLDPIYAETVSDRTILAHLYENLMRRTTDASGQETVTGAAARSYTEEANADGTVTYTFQIQGEWSDGRPVMAADFVFAWRRLADPANDAPEASLLSAVAGYDTVRETGDATALQVTAEDESTLTVVLSGSCGWFLSETCTSVAAMPLRQDLLPSQEPAAEGEAAGAEEPAETAGTAGPAAEADPWWSDVEGLVTNGPYQVSGYAAGESLTLTAAGDRDISGPASLTFRFASAPEDAQALYDAREVDFLGILPEERIAALAAEEDPSAAPESGVYTVVLNCGQDTLMDARVRRAMSLVIDRTAAAEAAGAAASPSGGLIPPGVPESGDGDFRTVGGTLLDSDPGHREELIQEARALLREAGYTDARDLGALEYLYVDEGAAGAVARVATESLQSALGIQASARAVTEEEFSAALDAGDFTLAGMEFRPAGSDAESYLMAWGSGREENAARYANSAYDMLLSIIAGAEDAAARLGCLHDAEAMLLEDGALAPLYTTVTAWTLREDYAGVRRDSRGWFDFTAAVPRGE